MRDGKEREREEDGTREKSRWKVRFCVDRGLQRQSEDCKTATFVCVCVCVCVYESYLDRKSTRLNSSHL